ncbi:hypothetical protein ADUPG1_006780 [Aduncisulcus paluster]|uniref:Uncharacterized protein n=1 Tax=Aduncisulcus paluster TaxID=2918883 RepID=A0ABQ5KJJ3_9EUKA|nr:hypothetical protein ADUPG1_006780 [Aduncisulcus paluster]|eukprot:gnl/Carplike_NY0171/2225_a3001_729.p1 GENE.gnl/Carplike_NY0171/2225_a3001_729~~gnl/Carplike_NY0171/2225_a3001_729.p1  ORF type:complete len:165 (-),score=39.57 gnl/Carplike_NY0171/2225_a3001_729:191-685(-)
MLPTVPGPRDISIKKSNCAFDGPACSAKFVEGDGTTLEDVRNELSSGEGFGFSFHEITIPMESPQVIEKILIRVSGAPTSVKILAINCFTESGVITKKFSIVKPATIMEWSWHTVPIELAEVKKIQFVAEENYKGEKKGFFGGFYIIVPGFFKKRSIIKACKSK